MCEWINETLQKSFDNGDWADAFESTLGKSGVRDTGAAEAGRLQELNP